jgi:hypothetical protein
MSSAEKIETLEREVAALKKAVERLQGGRCACGQIVVVQPDRYPSSDGIRTHSQAGCS